MRFLEWTAVFFFFHALLSGSQGSTRKRINFSPNYMSADDIIRYFKSFTAKTSSFNKINEAFYTDEFSEDLFHKIDNLMGVPQFNKWLMKTKEITDKSDMKGRSLLSTYQNALNAPCNPLTVFNSTLHELIRRWDGDQTVVSNELDEWHIKNYRVPPSEICNRFKGLTCQHKRALDPDLDQGKSVEITNETFCQCAQDPMNVGYYKSSLRKKEYPEVSYPDGCYVRPWRPCMYLSIDPAFKSHYYDWHKELENERRVLAQMVFPVGRAHRCKEDTLCLDMIPGMRRPICWCNPNSLDKRCIKTGKFKVPLGTELMKIRKNFVQAIIPSNDTKSMCNPEYNAKITMLARAAGKDPSRSGAMDIMEQLGNPSSRIRICDFRNDLMCDETSRTCQGSLNCDEGKIHVGKGVCAANNGFPCQTNEECVQNAKCKHFNGLAESACVCQTGYGDKCELINSAFFGSRFLPIISGFREQKFLKLQTEIHAALESWEDTMSLNEGDFCDPSADKNALDLVNWFGSLEEYDQNKGSSMLKMVHHVTKEITKSCRYTNFLRCDVISSRCVPIHGRKLLSISTDVLGSMKIVAEVEPKKECVVEMPKVFHSIVSFVCPRGYYCKKSRTGGHCLPDCDSVFAPLKECPQSLTPIPSLGTENPDPDAPVSPREVPDEEETTVTESSDLWDDQQQTTLVDKGVDSLTESSENVGNEVSNDISEPDNDKTVEPSVTEEDADNEGEGDTKNEIGNRNEIGDKNDIEGDTNSGPEDENENENDESDGRADASKCTANQIITNPGPTEVCKDCPEKSMPDTDKKNCDCTDPKQVLRPDPLVPDSLGTCKDCPDGKIQDPDKRNECKCEDNKYPVAGKETCKECGTLQTPDTPTTPCKCVDNAESDGNDKCKCNANAYQEGDKCIACKDDQVPNDPMKTEKCSCKDKNKIPDATSGECVCADDKMEHPSDSTKCICKEANQIPNKDTNACEECPTGEMRDPNDYYKCIAVSGSCPTGQKPNPEDLNQCICIDPNQILDPMDIKKCKDCDPGKKANKLNPSMCICQSESQYLVPPDNKECKDCDTDKKADPKNPTMCICKEGYIDDGKTCTECKDGRKANADRTKCVCPDGFAAATGEICKECDKNTGFEPNGDQTECVCKPGHIPDGTPPTKCTHCSTPGHYADLTSGTCKPCDAGMVPDAQHATCGPCPAGEVPDQDNPGACKACNAGEVPDPDPANIGKCKVCEGDLKPNTNKTECECGPGMMPDPNNVCVPATTTTTPAPGPITPKPGQFIGDKCDKMCGKHQQINGVECKEGFCRCVHGAKPEIPKSPKGRPKVCRIPLDHPCILKGKETVNSKNPDNRAPIACVAGSECVPVNSGNYCRRKEENGYIVISQNEYKKLPKNGGSSLDFTLSWKQLGALVMTIALTIPYNHAA